MKWTSYARIFWFLFVFRSCCENLRSVHFIWNITNFLMKLAWVGRIAHISIKFHLSHFLTLHYCFQVEIYGHSSFQKWLKLKVCQFLYFKWECWIQRLATSHSSPNISFPPLLIAWPYTLFFIFKIFLIFLIYVFLIFRYEISCTFHTDNFIAN